MQKIQTVDPVLERANLCKNCWLGETAGGRGTDVSLLLENRQQFQQVKAPPNVPIFQSAGVSNVFGRFSHIFPFPCYIHWLGRLLVFTTSEFHDLNSCNCCVCFHFSSFPFLWFDIRLSCADSVKWEEINNSGRYFCTVLSPPRIINFHFVFIWSKLLEPDFRFLHIMKYFRQKRADIQERGWGWIKSKHKFAIFELNFELQNPSGSASLRVNS